MRHIKQNDLIGSISTAWSQAAANALTDLLTTAVDDRADLITKNYKIWSDLKAAMAALSHEKCWYSEKRIAVSELEVDHFRPKNRVSGVTPLHRGYWWLAYDWKNFRLAYSLVNKRRTDSREGNVQGKGCYFPLVDEAARVPDDTCASTTAERPKLVDPCVASDVLLLDYAVGDGKVVERHKVEQDAIRFERANVSIDLFHLNEGTLIRDRHDLYVSIEHAVKRIEKLEHERESIGRLTDQQSAEFDSLINEVADRINASAPFSAFSRACLRQKGDLGWNTELLTTV
ncbi:hypothetical protein HKD28_03060 [Gluconobacter sp. LMG 1744]|uniref:hypothetical protein n=1 Tax=Gluconobacter cadivus TaxID=2728101 RepID=UPI00188507B0|nr:hypothetical protein [Gluconobacter cadivus]MBF0890406.1 hypothetical protein [Gluconobacter cadivus]